MGTHWLLQIVLEAAGGYRTDCASVRPCRSGLPRRLTLSGHRRRTALVGCLGEADLGLFVVLDGKDRLVEPSAAAGIMESRPSVDIPCCRLDG